MTQILRHLKLAAVPTLIAPAHPRQETFDWVADFLIYKVFFTSL
jgi:hypothetical protein